ncbi:2673_t:CDS:1 [Funneliformis geosporum]|uniref:3358_t:CDS:1 n=1 Tax=Funneliformis geosporum TaxID=1117311 RepID=A0A9W4SHB0_9GLOM|nr:3358_t:CDS:1 [Funneliformis geosporum]CAI2174771.1 2673_t:CDS:1 [Funneliformis geosporum]
MRLTKLCQTFKRNKLAHNKASNEIYIYTPLPIHKNGYIIEFRHSRFSEVYYYKYKENGDGTLTKYGYLICDNYPHVNSSKFGKNHNDKSRAIDYKMSFHSNDKECIFYQTVADKVQIALEKRWMNELRQKERVEVSATNDENDLFNNEWSDLMQHNNNLFISDNIQRRRLAEILDKSDQIIPQNIPRNLPKLFTQNLPLIDNQLSDNPSNPLNNNYNCEIFTPPLSPKTPPSSPTENYKHFSPKSLLNMNIRQRDRDRDQNKEKARKLVHLTHPKFSRQAPSVHVYDPEDNLIYKGCRCEYCMTGDYNE